jgi:hypothetical protein
MKRAIFLGTAAFLAMLILAPMAMGQGTTVLGGTTLLRPLPRSHSQSLSAGASSSRLSDSASSSASSKCFCSSRAFFCSRVQGVVYTAPRLV